MSVPSHVPLFMQPHGSRLTRLLCQWDFPGKNRILEWAAISSSRRSSWPRDWTHILLLHLLHWQADSLPLGQLGSYRYCIIVRTVSALCQANLSAPLFPIIPTVHVHSVFLSYSLVILTIFQTFSLLLYLLWWSVIFDTITMTCWRLRWWLAFLSRKYF